MKRRVSLVIAFLVAGCSSALLIASIFVKTDYISGVAGTAGAILTPLAFMAFSVVGTVIVVRRGNHPVGRLFLVAGAAWAVMWWSGVIVERAHALGHSPPDLVAWVSAWTEIVGIATVIMSLYVFPNGHPPSRRWRVWVALTAVAALVTTVAEAFAPGPLEDYPYFDNPYGLAPFFGTLRLIGWPSLIVPLLVAPIAVVTRYRRARGDERQQLKWMLFAGVMLVAFICFFAVSAGLVGDDRLAESFQGVALGAIPAAAGIAILKYRLYDIDVVINRALVYGSLTAILAVTYVGIVFGLQALLAPVTADSDLAIAASTLAVAGLFTPVRSRVQAFIDRRFYRRKFNAQRTIDEFNARLRDEVELTAVTSRLIDVARETMQPVHVSLWLRGETKA